MPANPAPSAGADVDPNALRCARSVRSSPAPGAALGWRCVPPSEPESGGSPAETAYAHGRRHTRTASIALAPAFRSPPPMALVLVVRLSVRRAAPGSPAHHANDSG